MGATPTDVLSALYGEFLERGVRYFFPGCRLEVAGRAESMRPGLLLREPGDGTIEIDWFRVLYRLYCPPLTAQERRLIQAIGSVLAERYDILSHGVSLSTAVGLFTGPPEDRFVSAFLERVPDAARSVSPAGPDVIADALQVLRESSLITYENRRIATGALLLGSGEDPQHRHPPTPAGALPYSSALVPIKSFNRLCDGLHTVFLVNREGLLIDVVDVHQWSGAWSGQEIGISPTPDIYRAHALATLHGGHICLVLTPNGEIEVFAEGVRVFSFQEGRWRLTDAAVKYDAWRDAVGREDLASRLYLVAINLAERRRGGLFVVLDDAASARELVAPGDLASESGPGKGGIHYLLRGRRLLDADAAVLESIARVDGGVVLDRDSNLLAFGAILRHTELTDAPVLEGGRTTAAFHASHFGPVLKISEDGIVSFYRDGRCVWDI